MQQLEMKTRWNITNMKKESNFCSKYEKLSWQKSNSVLGFSFTLNLIQKKV